VGDFLLHLAKDVVQQSNQFDYYTRRIDCIKCKILILELMMVDRYTRFILTIIAACLVIIVVRDIPIVSKALAQAALYRGDTLPVTIRGIDECSSCRWEALPVKIER